MTRDDDAEVGLGTRPEPDELARALRKSRVASALFGVAEQVRVGRYQLLERVGAGGISVVWGAWDPELERRVAIKLLRPLTRAPRERILLEGQALAKLSHPNVVPVYDVGLHGDQVYLVMEWVRGKTLRAYAAERHSVRELVEAYRAAGAGLAAAHDAGLIHRDFKPDNAIRGEDGRVRVLDFGLARSEPEGDVPADATLVTRGAGTPRYMAPEQAAGTSLTPACDQYAFCVSLREALASHDGESGRMPAWIETILQRGTSTDPGARYPSMHELLRALARDPARVWRRRMVAAGVVVVAAGAFVLGNWRATAPEVAPCESGTAQISRVWNGSVRTRVIEHVRGLGPYGTEEAEGLARDMASYGDRWARAHRDSCLAHRRRELTESVYARTLACLARAQAEYATVIEVLSTAPAERLADVVVAARGLPAVEQCAIDSAVSAVAPPHAEIVTRAGQLADEIERARVLARTDDPRGLDATRATLARADELGYTPLIARAYLAHGLALLRSEDADAAVPVLHRAALAALDAFDDATFVEAHAREVYARVASRAPPVDSEYAERIAQRTGSGMAVPRALLFNNLGAARLAAGEPEQARTWFDRALADSPTVERDAELLAAVANRALVTDDPAERDRLLDRARTALARLLGAHHRKTLDVRFQAAFFLADPRRAAAELDELCTLYRRYHPMVAQGTIANCMFELGWLAEERGDTAAARAAMQQVAPIDGPLPFAARAYLLALDGKLAEAAVAARAAGDRFRSESWARFNAADAYRLAAACNAELGRLAQARDDARAALELFEELAFLARMPNYQRRLARTRALLARIAPMPQAARHASDAAAWYRSAGGYDERVHELDAIAARGLKAGSR